MTTTGRSSKRQRAAPQHELLPRVCFVEPDSVMTVKPFRIRLLLLCSFLARSKPYREQEREAYYRELQKIFVNVKKVVGIFKNVRRRHEYSGNYSRKCQHTSLLRRVQRGVVVVFTVVISGKRWNTNTRLPTCKKNVLE
jgi:hypothetical protein